MANEERLFDAQKQMQDFMERHRLVLRVCNGAITFCDGNCENCGEDEDGDVE